MGVRFDLQKALYSALDLALTTPIFDHVPPDQSFPFVVIGPFQWANADTFTEQNSVVDVTLTIFSTYPGKMEVLNIADQIEAAVRNTSLALDSGQCPSVRVTRVITSEDPDGMTYTGSVGLQLFVQH